MTAKKIVQNFYKSDAIINPEIFRAYLHPEAIVEWHSSKGLLVLNQQEILDFTSNMSKAYTRSKARITHILQEGSSVSVRYEHFVKTIENPREEMLLAHFFAIWEIKDNLLFRGFQMSQLA